MTEAAASPDDATPVDPRMTARIVDVLLGSPVARQLGIGLVTAARDRVVLALPFRPGNVTLGRIVHGGVIATLVDVAGAAASASGADGADVAGGATGNLTIHYLAPADGCDLVAEAVVVKRGRRQTVSDVTVRAGGARRREGAAGQRVVPAAPLSRRAGARLAPSGVSRLGSRCR